MVAVDSPVYTLVKTNQCIFICKFTSSLIISNSLIVSLKSSWELPGYNLKPIPYMEERRDHRKRQDTPDPWVTVIISKVTGYKACLEQL